MTTESPMMEMFSIKPLVRQMGGLIAGGRRLDIDRASDYFWSACEAVQVGKGSHLDSVMLKQAALLDPWNIDVWLLLIDLAELDKDEMLTSYRQLIALGEKMLKEEFRHGKGEFWGILETRPYMRVRIRVAKLLMDSGDFEAAIVEHAAILALNHSDNQGVRYGQLALLLALRRLDEVEKLLQTYDECEFSAIFAWGRVLARYLAGDLPGADQALAVARKVNRLVEPYLRGDKALPKKRPDRYAPGSREEAVIAYDLLQIAWSRYPDACEWLCGQVKKSAAGRPRKTT